MVGSLTLTTGDTSYISQTVINGNQSGGCINIEGTSEVTLRGFTLTRGLVQNGGGISITSLGAVSLENLYIHGNQSSGDGGGVYISSLTVKN